MKQLLSFDIEIYNEIPEGTNNPDLHNLTPSIAALAWNVNSTVEYFWNDPYMTKDESIRLVNRMMEYSQLGYHVYGWNILGFDLPLIAYYSGMIKEVSELAINAIDPMFMVHCYKGYYLGLDSVLVGCGLETKVHSVTLNDKTVFSDMSGKKAPLLWRNGEFSAVMEYLEGDVIQPLKLALFIEQNGFMRWTSKAGKKQMITSKLMTVKECLGLPEQDQSWMTNPKPRKSYLEWMDLEVLNSKGINL